MSKNSESKVAKAFKEGFKKEAQMSSFLYGDNPNDMTEEMSADFGITDGVMMAGALVPQAAPRLFGGPMGAMAADVVSEGYFLNETGGFNNQGTTLNKEL